jgi:hypothetical protein
LTPRQWAYATGVLFYEWGANGYRAGRALVTGEAGRYMGERAALLSQSESGNAFDGDAGDWGRFSVNLAQEMTGVNAVAEGLVGVDAARHTPLDGWERATRISAGTGAMAGTAAGGFGVAGKCGVTIGVRPIPGTPVLPAVPLPDFMRRPIRNPFRQPAEAASVSCEASGVSRGDLHIGLREGGYEYHGTTKGGYVQYRNPDGSVVWIRPNGEVIRLAPKVTPSGGGKPYNPRIDAGGKRISTHNPGEFVNPLPGQGGGLP